MTADMGSTGLIQAGLLLLVASLGVSTPPKTPLRISEIDCGAYTDILLGSVGGNYEGVLEEVTGISAETTLVLNSPMFPEHLDYVELSYTPGETSATIRTKKPLDAKIFHESNGKLYYLYKCGCSKKIHMRKIHVIDTNQSPEFAQEIYSAAMSEE